MFKDLAEGEISFEEFWEKNEEFMHMDPPPEPKDDPLFWNHEEVKYEPNKEPTPEQCKIIRNAREYINTVYKERLKDPHYIGGMVHNKFTGEFVHTHTPEGRALLCGVYRRYFPVSMDPLEKEVYDWLITEGFSTKTHNALRFVTVWREVVGYKQRGEEYIPHESKNFIELVLSGQSRGTRHSRLGMKRKLIVPDFLKEFHSENPTFMYF